MTQDCQRLIKTWIRPVARWAAVSLCWAMAAAAQDVTITTQEDGVTLTGRVVSYDGALLQIDSPYGLMTLNYQRLLT